MIEAGWDWLKSQSSECAYLNFRFAPPVSSLMSFGRRLRLLMSLLILTPHEGPNLRLAMPFESVARWTCLKAVQADQVD
jgi:hypothetical protein